MKVTKIVITGGPCAGKSEAKNWIRETFTKKGYTVLFIPETATELISGGVAPWTCGTNLDYQLCQCQLQMFKEEIFNQAIRTMKDAHYLVVCDRAMFDNKAYMTDDEFDFVLKSLHQTEDALYKRYDAIFHLVSAAKGLEEMYSFDNNSARYETVEEAQALDDRLLACWSKHPYLKVIENHEDFDMKMKNLMNEISKVLENE